MRYTQEQYQKARSVNLAAYLAANGYELEKSGNEFLLKNPHGVTVRDNEWYDHYEKEGGGGIQFLVKYENASWAEAVLKLAGEAENYTRGTTDIATTPCEKKEKKAFALPERAPDHRRVFSYLTQTRRIDADIVRQCLEEKTLYESYEKDNETGNVHRNCVFVGFDEKGVARNAMIRGAFSYETKRFRRNVEGSEMRIPFRLEGESGTVYVYESPIDLLSHAAVHKRIDGAPDGWRHDSRIALCGTHDAPLEWFLQKRPDVVRITFCLDRDQAGLSASASLMDMYAGSGYEVGCLLPKNKDWNEDAQFGTYEGDSNEWINAEMEA